MIKQNKMNSNNKIISFVLKNMGLGLSLSIFILLMTIPNISYSTWNTQLNKGDILTPLVWNDFINKLSSFVSINTTLVNNANTLSSDIASKNTDITNINNNLTTTNNLITIMSGNITNNNAILTTLNTTLTTLNGKVNNLADNAYMGSFLSFTGGKANDFIGSNMFLLTGISGGLSSTGAKMNFVSPVGGKFQYGNNASSTNFIMNVSSGSLEINSKLGFYNTGTLDEGDIGNGQKFTNGGEGLNIYGILGGGSIKTTFLGGNLNSYGNLSTTGSINVNSDSSGDDEYTFNGYNKIWIKQYKDIGENFGLKISHDPVSGSQQGGNIKNLSGQPVMNLKQNNFEAYFLQSADTEFVSGGGYLANGWGNSYIKLSAINGANQMRTGFGVDANNRKAHMFNNSEIGAITSSLQPLTITTNFNGTTNTIPNIDFLSNLEVHGYGKTNINGNLNLNGVMQLGNLSSDPSGVNGMIYFNTTLNDFRCFETGVWKNCGGTTIDVNKLITYSGSNNNKNILISSYNSSFCVGNNCTASQTLPNGVNSNTPGTSCKQIKIDYSSSTDGVYWINPGSESTAFKVYCNMSYNGGGWTLIMKTNGSNGQFRYNSDYWTNINSTLNEDSTDLLKTSEYKGRPFNELPFDEMLVSIDTAGTIGNLVIPLPNTKNAVTLFQGSELNTSIGRANWKSLISASSLQSNCSKEGINLTSSFGNRVRIGIQGNNEADCLTPDSRLGIGMSGNNGLTIDGLSVGNTARISSDNGDKDIYSFAYIYVK